METIKTYEMKEDAARTPTMKEEEEEETMEEDNEV